MIVRSLTDVGGGVFDPPVTGREVHDEKGVHPLPTEGP